jgi:tetratricopeptide (TPR) repeat protein
VAARLKPLAQGEWLAARRASRLAGEPEHAFRHALVREAAYGSLTESDRAAGHRAAAIWLEGTGEADPLVLAEHHERGGDPRAAARWLARGASHALEANQLTEALSLAARALELGAEGEELGQARLAQAEAHNWRGEHTAAEGEALEAASLLPRGGARWAAAVHHAVWACCTTGRYDTATALSEELGALLAPPAGPAVVASACAVATQLVAAGRPREAQALIDRIAPNTPPEALPAAWLASAGGHLAFTRGRLDEARRLMLEAAQRFDEAGDRRNACMERGNAGYLSLELGAFAEGEGELRAAAEVAARLGITPVVQGSRQNLGLALYRMGALDEARALLEEAARAFAAGGDRRMEAVSHVYLALVAGEAGEAGEAERRARAALDILAVPAFRAYALAALARVLLARGELQAALSAAREAAEIVKGQDANQEGDAFVRLVVTEVLLGGGQLLAARAEVAAARDRLLERAGAIADVFWRERFLSNVPENARTLSLARELERSAH